MEPVPPFSAEMIMKSLITKSCVLLALAAAAFSQAQVPGLLNYQGRVAVGTVNFDGSGQFKFALVDAAGTTTYWSNDGSSAAGSEPAAAVTVPVSKGLYAVLLGDATLANMTPIPAAVFNHADVRLRVWFNDGVNGFQWLAPDQRIAAVGYAMVASGVNLSATTSDTSGVVQQAGVPLLHTFGTSNFFAGVGAGNFTLTGSDNVGIGKGTFAANTTGHNNVAIGNNALALNTTGLANTAVGHNALDLVTNGNQNTAAGAYALGNNDSGSNNTAAGYQALLNDSTGSHNTAFGHQALRDNTTGSSNIAIGKSAGINLTTGDSNIVIGHAGVAGETKIIRIGSNQTDTYLTGVIHGDGSGLTGIVATSLAPNPTVSGVVTAGGFSLPSTTNASTGVITQNGSPLLQTYGTGNFFAGASAGNFTTSGSNNTAAGSQALAASTSGSGNTAVGVRALENTTTGFNNTAAGVLALNANTTGAYNASVGWHSLQANVSGWNNTAVGRQALGNMISGDSNIGIGVSAGSALTTGSNNIAIGNVGVAGESGIVRIGTSGTHTDTHLAGVVHGNGAGLTGITGAGLASGAAAENLAASQQSGVSSGGIVLSTEASSAELLAAGYAKFGSSTLALGESWTATQAAGTPAQRAYHCAVWTGTEMIIWGGYDGTSYLNTGGRYNPVSHTWTAISQTNAPSARFKHKAVWTGSEMIVWGGNAGTTSFDTGARYNPATDTWTPMTTTNAPSNGRTQNSAVWTGTEMIVWGGSSTSPTVYHNTGARYNPATNTWTAMSTTSAPAARHQHYAVWTGTEMIVWGGRNGGSFFNDGARYNPTTNTWSAAISTTNAPTARGDTIAAATVWTGSEMIVWGGYDGTYLGTGARYRPATDTWTPVSSTAAPSARANHTAVWTGDKMIVWGGFDGARLSTGAYYTPAADTWTATAASNITARADHSSVWTGSEMIIWGGASTGVYFADGSRLTPAGIFYLYQRK